MNISISRDRSVTLESNDFGSVQENNFEVLNITFPEGFENYYKTIEFQTSEGNYVDAIIDDTYNLTTSITKYPAVRAQIVAKDLENDITFKSDIFKMKFSPSLNVIETIEVEEKMLIEELILNIQQVEERVISLENRQNMAESEIEAIKTKNLEQDELIENILQKNIEQDSQIDIINKKNEEQDGALNNIEEKNNTQDTLIEDLQTKTTNINKILDEQETRIEQINSKDIAQDLEIENIKQKNIEQDTSIENLIVENEAQALLIKELEAENTRLKEDINGLPSGTAEGESIDITDSAEMRFKAFEISGNSKQDGEPSPENPSEVVSIGANVNLYNKETMPLTNGLWISSTNIGSNTSGWYIIVPITGGKTYTISKKNTCNDSSALALGLATTAEYPTTGIAQVDNWTADKTKREMTIQTSTSANYLFVGLATGKTTDVTEEMRALAIEELKVEEGSKATPYSPYGLGRLGVEICNKNILKMKDGEYSSNGLTAIVKNGIITINGTTTNASLITIPLEKTIKAGIEVTTSINNEKTITASTEPDFRLGNYSSASVYFGKINNFKTYTTVADITNVQIRTNATNVTYSNFVIKPQVELGENVTAYIEHKSQTYIIPTQKPFRAIGDVKDTFIKQDGKWYEKHIIKELVLNGEENWQYNSTSATPYFYITSSNYVKNAQCLSNKYGYINTLADNNIGIKVASSQFIQIRNPNYTDVASFKNELKNNNVIVYYVLETPELIECTEEQVKTLDEIEKEAKSYKNITHIYSTDEVSPIINVSYFKDIDTMINNLNNAIVALGGV